MCWLIGILYDGCHTNLRETCGGCVHLGPEQNVNVTIIECSERPQAQANMQPPLAVYALALSVGPCLYLVHHETGLETLAATLQCSLIESYHAISTDD